MYNKDGWQLGQEEEGWYDTRKGRSSISNGTNQAGTAYIDRDMARATLPPTDHKMKWTCASPIFPLPPSLPSPASRSLTMPVVRHPCSLYPTTAPRIDMHACRLVPSRQFCRLLCPVGSVVSSVQHHTSVTDACMVMRGPTSRQPGSIINLRTEADEGRCRTDWDRHSCTPACQPPSVRQQPGTPIGYRTGMKKIDALAAQMSTQPSTTNFPGVCATERSPGEAGLCFHLVYR